MKQDSMPERTSSHVHFHLLADSRPSCLLLPVPCPALPRSSVARGGIVPFTGLSGAGQPTRRLNFLCLQPSLLYSTNLLASFYSTFVNKCLTGSLHNNGNGVFKQTVGTPQHLMNIITCSELSNWIDTQDWLPSSDVQSLTNAVLQLLNWWKSSRFMEI